MKTSGAKRLSELGLARSSVLLRFGSRPVILWALAMLALNLVLPASAEKHRRKEDYGIGLTTEIDAPEDEVLQAVQEVVENGMIQGSKEYNKDKAIENASSATSSSLFPDWKEAGKVFYKVRTEVLD